MEYLCLRGGLAYYDHTDEWESEDVISIDDILDSSKWASLMNLELGFFLFNFDDLVQLSNELGACDTFPMLTLTSVILSGQSWEEATFLLKDVLLMRKNN